MTKKKEMGVLSISKIRKEGIVEKQKEAGEAGGKAHPYGRAALPYTTYTFNL